ncbi:MAG TPA: DoxX family protein [Anaerolineales bacterium]|nr:DoxX family protein [Anaerolineales bacterium]
MVNVVTTRKGQEVQNPSFISKLFNHPLAGLIWLPIRVWIGWQWLEASLHKFSSPAWMQTGLALKGFWAGAVAIPATGTAPIHYAWYRAFLQMLLNAHAYTWFAKLVPVGEFLVGVCLILGIFTGFSAFMGGFMNFNFMMAGSASVNPMFFALSVLLVLGWKISGYFGADYFLVPWIGSLWARKGEKSENVSVRAPKGAEA